MGGYTEWNFAGALSILAVLADKKLVYEIKQSTINCNIFIQLIGESTISRKTTAVDKAKEFMRVLGLTDKQIPESFSPEAFTEIMSAMNHAFFWKDESASVLAAMQKSYMEEFRDMLCDMYECHPYHRALRTSQRTDKKTQFDIEDTYLNIFWATTPDNFANYATMLDVTSGWLLRFIYLCPTYEKAWMGFEERTEEDVRGWMKILDELKEIQKYIDDSPVIKFKMTKECKEFYGEWQKNSEQKMFREGDKVATSLFGRLQVYVIKLAMLFAFADKKFSLRVIAPPNREAERVCYFKIEEIKAACSIIDNTLLPSAREVISKIEEDREMKDAGKIKNLVLKLGSIRKSDILQRCHISAKRANDAIEWLVQAKIAYVDYEQRTDTYWIRKYQGLHETKYD